MSTALAERLEKILVGASMKFIDVAQLLDVRPETVSRWNQGRAYPHRETEKALLELEYIVDQLGDFYEPNQARQWLFARQKLLGGQSPAELIKNGKIDEVLLVVNQLRDGVYL